MDWKSFFIKDVNKFNKLKNIQEDIFLLDKEFPNQVFQKEFSNYRFEQFDNLMSEEFWTTIRRLAEWSKDEYVIFAVLSPHPKDYYYKEFGYFNWLELPINLTGDDYLDILNEGPQNYEADAIINNSFIITLFSPSKKWGIWADRDYEITVIAFNDNDLNIDVVLDTKVWLSAENEVVQEWMSYTFRPDFKVPHSISNKLIMNYAKNR
ncbi:hypothetical protein ACFCYN_25465 [Gottfriedia sp. NPDC056225]|uniref:hypothetical protein n=1 Tax=Gottfriedia sp. NPDC056225 TaxID=3345751 RepID=UPI0035DD1EF8